MALDPNRLLIRVVDAPALDRSSFLIVCGRTRAAAVIDPLPDTTEELADVISERGLRVRWVIHTRDGTCETGHDRMAELAASLGLRQARASGTVAETPWDHAPVVRVAGPIRDGRVPIQVGVGVVRTAVDPHVGGRPMTALGSLAVDVLPAEALRLAFGAYHLHVLPWGSDRLGLVVEDRLVVPCALPPAGPPLDLPRSTSELAPETIVYAAEQGGISTLERERGRAVARVTCTMSDLFDSNALAGLAGFA